MFTRGCTCSFPFYWASLENTIVNRPEYESESCLVMSNSLQPHGWYSPWNYPGQNTRMGRLSLLQEIFPVIQLRSPPLQVDSLPAEPQGKLKNIGLGSVFLLQWIFPTQNWTRVSCMASGFLINWAIRPTITIFFLNIFLRHTSNYLMVMMLF